MKQIISKFNKKTLTVILAIIGLIVAVAGVYLYKNNIGRKYFILFILVILACSIGIFILNKGQKDEQHDDDKWMMMFEEIARKEIKTKDALLELDLPIDFRLLIEKSLVAPASREEYLSLVVTEPISIKIATESLYFLLEKNSKQEFEYAYNNLKEERAKEAKEKREKQQQNLTLINSMICIMFLLIIAIFVVLKYMGTING